MTEQQSRLPRLPRRAWRRAERGGHASGIQEQFSGLGCTVVVAARRHLGVLSRALCQRYFFQRRHRFGIVGLGRKARVGAHDALYIRLGLLVLVTAVEPAEIQRNEKTRSSNILIFARSIVGAVVPRHGRDASKRDQKPTTSAPRIAWHRENEKTMRTLMRLNQNARGSTINEQQDRSGSTHGIERQSPQQRQPQR